MRICPVSAIFVTANGWDVNRAGGNCSHRHSTLSRLGSLSLVSHHITPQPESPPQPESLRQKSTSARLPLKSNNQQKQQPTNSTSFSFIKAHVVVTGQHGSACYHTQVRRCGQATQHLDAFLDLPRTYWGASSPHPLGPLPASVAVGPWLRAFSNPEKYLTGLHSRGANP